MNNNQLIIISVMLFVAGGIAGYLYNKTTTSPLIVTHVESSIVTVTDNIQIDYWKNKYLEAQNTIVTVTVNNRIVETIIVTSKNAEDIANRLQQELISYENEPLALQMHDYFITDGDVPFTIKMDATLYKRSWKLEVLNKGTLIKTKQEEDPLQLSLTYSINKHNINIGIEKELLTLPIFNIPVLLGVSYTYEGNK